MATSLLTVRKTTVSNWYRFALTVAENSIGSGRL